MVVERFNVFLGLSLTALRSRGTRAWTQIQDFATADPLKSRDFYFSLQPLSCPNFSEFPVYRPGSLVSIVVTTTA